MRGERVKSDSISLVKEVGLVEIPLMEAIEKFVRHT
jgi:hypothetical protein